ncbi:MAG: DUF29 domain-containing protein [Acetobacteraceae bacterium]|nr:DUF29 domain-containing protein [Acetobacteraceae bacterium]
MADIQEASLYDRDFCEWANGQARAVRVLRDATSGQGNLPGALENLDWEHLIEELEDLAGRHRSELRCRIATIAEYLVKLELSQEAGPRPGWRETVRRFRLEIDLLLVQSPSLRREVPGIPEMALMAKVAKNAVETLADLGEVPARTTAPTYTEVQILEDWWPAQGGNGA